METLIELAKISIPAALVLYAMFLTVKSFLAKEMENKILDLRKNNSETVMPIRLQAYERVCLFLERISPNNLIRRVSDNSFSARQLQEVLLNEIRNEFNHNLSQQVYMSDEAWNLIKNSMEEVIVVINAAANELPAEAKGIDLSKRIFESLMERNADSTSTALTFVKDEIRQVF